MHIHSWHEKKRLINLKVKSEAKPMTKLILWRDQKHPLKIHENKTLYLDIEKKGYTSIRMQRKKCSQSHRRIFIQLHGTTMGFFFSHEKMSQVIWAPNWTKVSPFFLMSSHEQRGRNERDGICIPERREGPTLARRQEEREERLVDSKVPCCLLLLCFFLSCV